MKLAITACAVFAGLFAVAFAGESQSPAEWIAQLGADHLSERDAASAALLDFGSQAREEVRRALNSPDVEVQWRARELWKTLRWMVVPGADADVRRLVEDSKRGRIDKSHWIDFVKKHGAESILLVVEFRANALPAKPGLLAVLEQAPPLDVARMIAQAKPARARPLLEAALDEISPKDSAVQLVVNIVQIQIALWNYQKAFDFGREAAFRFDDEDLLKQCAIAVDRGKLFDQGGQTAREDIAAETDSKRLCAKLSFYIRLLHLLGKDEQMSPLCDLAQKADLFRADDSALRRLVESLLKVQLPGCAIKALHLAHTPLTLYMRSVANARMQNTPAADADWRDVLAALGDVGDAKKEEAYFTLGELMNEWDDPRAESMWQKILDTPPENSVYDANACLRLAAISEKRHQYTRAADLYEKGLEIAKSLGGVLIVSGPKDSDEAGGEEQINEKIKKLRALAAGRSSTVKEQQPARKDAAP